MLFEVFYSPVGCLAGIHVFAEVQLYSVKLFSVDVVMLFLDNFETVFQCFCQSFLRCQGVVATYIVVVLEISGYGEVYRSLICIFYLQHSVAAYHLSSLCLCRGTPCKLHFSFQSFMPSADAAKHYFLSFRFYSDVLLWRRHVCIAGYHSWLARREVHHYHVFAQR